MVIDTSALIAILTDEPERRAFNEKIVKANACCISAGSCLETYIVIEARYGYKGVQDLTLYVQEAAIEIIPFDAQQVELARSAYTNYGKGRHRASLNFGDCFAYALAKQREEPLLFKGEDFSLTDLEIA